MVHKHPHQDQPTKRSRRTREELKLLSGYRSRSSTRVADSILQAVKDQPKIMMLNRLSKRISLNMAPPSTVRCLAALATLVVVFAGGANAHGTLLDPVSRNSLWRVDSSAPVNYNDIELFCGGIGAVRISAGRCGVCGDPISFSRPRPHETGGYMVTNKTVKNYFPGSTVDVLVDLVTNHRGYFEFELCRRDSFEVAESDDCFERLKFADGTDRHYLNTDGSNGMKSLSLQLPDNLRECRACVLRWNYRAGNNWGRCPDGSAGMGCGPQELYRNCADISVGHQLWQSPSSENGI